jgi:hypothetical protein
MHANPGVNRLQASDSRLFAFIRGSRLRRTTKLTDRHELTNEFP